jgi:hypothetical protein
VGRLRLTKAAAQDHDGAWADFVIEGRKQDFTARLTDVFRTRQASVHDPAPIANFSFLDVEPQRLQVPPYRQQDILRLKLTPSSQPITA